MGATQKIIKDVAEVRKKVDALKLDKQLPFGTSDAGSMFTTTLAEGIDYFHANGKACHARLTCRSVADVDCLL